MTDITVSGCHIALRLLQAEGVVKYNHNDSVQVLAYNPLSQQLASGTANDFGLWSPDLKHVAKHKVSCSPIQQRLQLLQNLLQAFGLQHPADTAHADLLCLHPHCHRLMRSTYCR